MSKYVRGLKSQRRGLAVAAATASLLLLPVGAPLAAADTGQDGGGGTGSTKHAHTDRKVTGPSRLASTVKQGSSHIGASRGSIGVPTTRTQFTSGRRRTVLPNTSTPKAAAPTLAQAPGPGINIGNPPPGMPGSTGNTNYGNQTNPASVQLYNLGSSNNNVANNTGPDNTVGGLGVNLVNLRDGNTFSGNNTVGANNFGANIVSMGSGNHGQDVFVTNGSNLVNAAPQSSDLAGSFGGNLAFLGDNNEGVTGFNHVEGANSIGLNMVSAGNRNVDAANNAAAGNNVFGANFAEVGSDTFESGYNFIRNTGGAGTTAFGANFATVGDGATHGAENLGAGGNQVVGANAFGTNWAMVLSTTANPTVDSGTNTVQNDGLFGNNFAFVGAGSTNVGNNTSASAGGGLNLVWGMGNNTNVGNNTGGGINLAVELPGATNVGNCASGLCVNLFGIQLLGP